MRRRNWNSQHLQGAAAVGQFQGSFVGILVLIKTVVIHLDPLPVHVPVVVFPEILDVVIPRLHIRAAGHLGIELLERDSANFGEHVVDSQLDQLQVLWGDVISIVSSLKNLNGFFAVRHFNLPVSVRGTEQCFARGATRTTLRSTAQLSMPRNARPARGAGADSWNWYTPG